MSDYDAIGGREGERVRATMISSQGSSDKIIWDANKTTILYFLFVNLDSNQVCKEAYASQ